MNSIGKRAGWFALAFLGLVASFGLQIVMGILGVVLASLVAGMKAGLQGLDPASLENLIYDASAQGAVWGVLAYHVISLPIFGVWYYFGCGRRKPVSPFKVIYAKRFFVVFVISFGLCLLANGMVVLEEFIMPGFYQQYTELMDLAGFGVNPLTIIASVILAPIGEELLCRGIILHYCMKATDGLQSRQMQFWIANVIQALFFAIMHGNIIQGSYAFVLGLGLGYLRYRYDSLYPSILAHFLINFLSTFVMGFVLFAVPETILGAVALLIVGSIISAFAVRMDKQNGEGA